MRNPQFYVSGKRPIGLLNWLWGSHMSDTRVSEVTWKFREKSASQNTTKSTRSLGHEHNTWGVFIFHLMLHITEFLRVHFLNIQLHLISFRNTDMTHVIEIHPRIRQGHVYPMEPISWLLMFANASAALVLTWFSRTIPIPSHGGLMILLWTWLNI